MDRFSVLIGRLHKIENLQSKLANLMDCRVFGGELPEHIREQIKSPAGQAKLKARIDKAEKIKLKIAIALYDDAT